MLSSAPLLLQAGTGFSALTLLALIQGLTEFLPISSSGHLVLAQDAMGVEEPALALDVALHLGTLLAVVVVYRKDLLRLVTDAFAGRLNEALYLILATVPAGCAGVFLGDHLEAAFHSPRVASMGLFVTAALLLVGEAARRKRLGTESRPLTWKVALAVGLVQALAIIPGISRSGSTIAIGILLGLEPKQAARFSFLLSIPAILGAAVLKLPDAMDEGFSGGGRMVIWAALFAGFVGWGALRMLLTFLGRGAFGWFAAYCIGLGVGATMFS